MVATVQNRSRPRYNFLLKNLIPANVRIAEFDFKNEIFVKSLIAHKVKIVDLLFVLNFKVSNLGEYF